MPQGSPSSEPPLKAEPKGIRPKRGRARKIPEPCHKKRKLPNRFYQTRSKFEINVSEALESLRCSLLLELYDGEVENVEDNRGEGLEETFG